MTSATPEAIAAKRIERGTGVIAGPRIHFSQDPYTGAELVMQSTRPGAYAALQLPSLVNGKTQAPGAAIAYAPEHWSPPPPSARAPVTPRARPVAKPPKPARAPHVPRASYEPREGSVPYMLLEFLREHGGHMTYAEITRRFGTPCAWITSVFKPAIQKGSIARLVINDRTALALPGYTPAPELLLPSKARVDLLVRLAARQARLRALQAEVADIQERITTLA